ncbi:MAG: response regulator transcription factor [Chloroflexi bacterium]|nr:response regulator transcription factor [Chloroflexota bacterium]
MTARQRILVADDEPQICDVVELYLRREGFEVETATDGETALKAVEHNPPDLIVLDLMMPKVNGLEVTRIVHDQFNIPIIMLTSRGEEADKIAGLETGADDYVVKPFSPKELVARVKAVLRRAGAQPADETQSSTIQVGDLTIDATARLVTINGQAVENLTVKEFDLLWFLASSPGQVFSRDQLLNQVWGYDFYGDSNTVTVLVRRLREKIETDPANPQYLLTVWGVGYKFARPYPVSEQL